MKRKMILTLFISLLWGVEIFPQQISLSEAINLALSNNPDLKIQNLKVKSAENELKKAWGNFFPSLNFEGGFTRMNSPLELDLEPFRQLIITLQAGNQTELRNLYNITSGGTSYSPAEKSAIFNQYYSLLNNQIPAFNMELKKQNYYHGELTAVQPLFLGGKLIAYKNYRNSNLNYEKNEQLRKRNELISKISDIYLKAYLLQNIVEIRKEVIAAVQRHKSEAEKAFDEGLVTKFSITKAEVALSEATLNYKRDRHNSQLLILSLKELCGLDKSDLSIKLIDPQLPEESFNLKDFLNKSQLNHPAIKMIEEKINQAEDNYIIKRSEFLPQIAAFGMKEVYPEYLSVLEPKWVIGVQLKMNLFNGFKDYMELENANYLKEQADYKKESIKRKINLWVNKNYKELLNALDELKLSGKRIELASENLRIAEKKFESGTGTTTEVIDAELGLEKAKIDQSTAIYKYYSALLNLFEASGEPEKILEFID